MPLRPAPPHSIGQSYTADDGRLFECHLPSPTPTEEGSWRQKATNANIAAENLTLFPIHADTTDPATVSSSENILESSGVRAITFEPTTVAQRVVHEILEAGNYQLEITKFATTPITIQVMRGTDSYAKDLSVAGVLSNNAVDTSELSLSWAEKDNDVSWIVDLGPLAVGDLLRLWGNDLGDTGDFNGYEYALTRSGSVVPDVSLSIVAPTANPDITAKVGVSQAVTVALSPNTYLQSVDLDGVAQKITEPKAGVFWLENPSSASSTITVTEGEITTKKVQTSVGEYYFAANKVDGVNLDTAATYSTGIDFTRCKTAQMALSFNTTEDRQQVATASISWASNNTAHMQFNYEGATTDRYVNASFASEADARAGRIIFDSSSPLYAIWIEGFTTDEAPFTIPEAYKAASERFITQVGGTGFINGADTATTPALVHEGFLCDIQLGITPGSQLESATSAEFGPLEINVLAGTARYKPGANNDTITITEKLSAVADIWMELGVFEFNPGNDQGININTATTWTHNIPMQEGDQWRIRYSMANDLTNSYYSQWTPFILGANNSQMISGYRNGATNYVVYGRCDDQAMADARQMRLDASSTMYAQFLEVQTKRSTALAVPEAYRGATDRNITLVGGTGLINGFPTRVAREGIDSILQIGLSPNKQLDTITSANGYQVEIQVNRTGTASAPYALVYYVAGAADDVLTITEVDAPTYVADLIDFSCTPLVINAVMPDTGGFTGTVRWTPDASIYTVFDPDGIINADGVTLDLPQGRYEAILTCRAGNSRLIEMGVFLDGAELNHVDAPLQSGSGVPKTISSTTQPLIFDVPAGGGAVTVQKQSVSDTTIQNFAFTLKQRPTATEVVLDATVIATPVTMTANSAAGVVEGNVYENVWSEVKVPLSAGNYLIGTPTLMAGGAQVGSVAKGNSYAGILKVLVPLGTSPATVDIVYTEGPYPPSTIEYLFATAGVRSTPATSNNHATFDTIQGRQLGSNIILDTSSSYATSNAATSVGRILVKGNTGLYNFEGAPCVTGSGYAGFSWYNLDTGEYIGVTASYEDNANLGASRPGVAVALVEPVVDTRYELRMRSSNFSAYRSDSWGSSYCVVKKIIENQGI